ncbi:MAG: TonB-dependent receptor [Bacteroidales bacterium]|nr:TonB-dependent receptor [Bacteroidales bacterium]MCF8455073.1 TonB-dependent receptor [Bacteroidales bacterium]
MKKGLLIIIFSVLAITVTFSQKYRITGIVKATETGETLIGANIVLKSGVGTVSDFDGRFSIEVEAGEYNVSVTYVGFEGQEKKINLNKNMYFEFNLNSRIIDEVSVVADVAIARETPVAFTNVLPAKIEEELAGQDIPMILNSTPGVYATQQGGGDGDARITIRGFSQSNVGVMLDGIPVNDMENGWVYWSNWFGLDQVTRSIQVQRGLGASKLALPSVGGTMNILTKGIEEKKRFDFKQELSSEGKSTSSLAYNSGKLPGNWGVTMAFSHKKGDGWVDETWSNAYFYYGKVEKRLGNHILSFSTYGAPQSHGQRAYKRAIATYDSTYAVDVAGVTKFPWYKPTDGDTIDYVNKGITYNQQWGYLERYKLITTDSMYIPTKDIWLPTAYDTIHANREKIHLKENIYFKPMYSLRDFWSVNDRLYISNILYLSTGKGGGTDMRNSLKDNNLDENGQINFQEFYDANVDILQSANTAYSLTERQAGNYRVLRRNEHFWYGFLSTFNYRQSELLEFSGGIDLRSYKGSHTQEVYDLLGADYAISENQNLTDPIVREGGNVYFSDDEWVRWGGLFGQVEFKTGIYSTFFNVSGAYTGFQKEDYFQLPDSPTRKTDWLWKPSYTFKWGFNYNLTERANVFINTGYLSKVRPSDYIYQGYSAAFRDNTDNEVVKAVELGYTFTASRFAINVNSYYTRWLNRAMNSISTKDGDVDLYMEIPGVDALHMGIETDVIYKILPNLELQGLASIGDWRWTSKVENVSRYNRNTGAFYDYFDFDATGVHISDAAQTQYAASIRYEPVKSLYLMLKGTSFDRYFAQMEPTTLTGTGNAIDADGNPRDSWEAPKYTLFDLHAGYTWNFESNQRITFTFSLLNIFDALYITDAQNNDGYIYSKPTNNFDANSASVFFGMGRRFSTSIKLSF